MTTPIQTAINTVFSAATAQPGITALGKMFVGFLKQIVSAGASSLPSASTTTPIVPSTLVQEILAMLAAIIPGGSMLSEILTALETLLPILFPPAPVS